MPTVRNAPPDKSKARETRENGIRIEASLAHAKIIDARPYFPHESVGAALDIRDHWTGESHRFHREDIIDGLVCRTFQRFLLFAHVYGLPLGAPRLHIRQGIIREHVEEKRETEAEPQRMQDNAHGDNIETRFQDIGIEKPQDAVESLAPAAYALQHLFSLDLRWHETMRKQVLKRL